MPTGGWPVARESMSESGRSSIALTMAGAAIVAAAVIVIARWSPAPAGTHRAGLQGPAPAVLSADAETTLGPGPGESAWIEAEVAGPEAGPWQLLLASVSERDEVLVESEPGARIALIAVRDGKRRTLGTAVLPSRLGAMGPAMPQGRPASIWARRRGEAWSVWIDGELVFAAEARVEGDACLPSGTARVGFRARRRSAGPEGPRLVRMSAMPPTDPAFRDSFMREDPGETWRALAGAWEMAGIRYPERSAYSGDINRLLPPPPLLPRPAGPARREPAPEPPLVFVYRVKPLPAWVDRAGAGRGALAPSVLAPVPGPRAAARVIQFSNAGGNRRHARADGGGAFPGDTAPPERPRQWRPSGGAASPE